MYLVASFVGLDNNCLLAGMTTLGQDNHSACFETTLQDPYILPMKQRKIIN